MIETICARRAAFLAVLILAATSCGKDSEPPKPKSAVADLPTNVDERSSDPRLSFDPLSELLAKVEDKTWTYEEGLIFNLKVLAGEIESDLYRNTQEQFEAGDLITAAKAYIRSGPDEETKSELQRLLGSIEISTEDLLKHSVPVDLEPQSNTSRPADTFVERFLDLIVSPANAQEPPGCQMLWSAGIPVTEQPSGICFGVHEWRRHGNTHRIFFPLPWSRNDDARFQFISAAKDALNQSLDTFVSELGISTHDTNTLFLEGDSPEGHLAATWPEGESLSPRSNCRIAAYRPSYDPGTDSLYARYGNGAMNNFKQVIAHEVFHCVQIWNLTPQMYGAAGMGQIESGVFQKVRKWWSEGSAEYFSNVVYPCNQLEWSRTDNFDDHAPQVSIVDLTYENTFVFQYLGTHLGNTGVYDILRSMPTSGSSGVQINALDSTRAADEFHEFGKRYIENQIQDSCRAASDGDHFINFSPKLDSIAVQEGAEYEFESASYQLNMKKMLYLPGDMEIRYESSGTEATDSYEDLRGAGWMDPPANVNASCSDAEGNLLFTATRATGRLNYRIRVLGDPPPEFKLDRCLVGRWEATSASAREIAEWAAANPLTKANTSTEVAEITGTLSGLVEDNGRASGSMIDFTSRFVSEIKIGEKVIHSATSVTTNGLSTGRYSASDSKLTVWGVCTESSAHATVEMDGKVISDKEIDLQAIASGEADPTVPAEYFASGVESSGAGELLGTVTKLPTKFVFDYRCQGGSLEIDPPDALDRDTSAGLGNRPPWRFTKQ